MIPFFDEVAAMPDAIEALHTALRDGLEPEDDQARSRVPVTHGELLLMPAEWGSYTGVKLATIAPNNPALGRPRIQGAYLLLDAASLTPLAMLDGAALTTLRTAAVSALAVSELAVPDVARLVVFGTGPQARSHIAAIRAIRPVGEVVVIGRSDVDAFTSSVDGRPGSVADIEDADVIVCATTARAPLFDGSLLPPHATVVAVGSHELTAREVDDTTVCMSTVVVEARSAALREAGDLAYPLRAGTFDPATMLDLASVVRGAEVAMDRPRLFKSVGMAWEDLVVAARTWERHQ